MDPTRLRAFLAVADELHFGHAAAVLRVAQSALTRSIQRLEAELGAPLFDRSTRSVALTSAGRAFLDPARRILAEAERARDLVAAAHEGRTGVVRIAFAGVSTYRVVADVAMRVRTSHPGIRLELASQQFADAALQRLREGETDLALGRWDDVPESVHVDVVSEDTLVVAVPADRAAMLGGPFSALADEDFIALATSARSVLDARLRELAQAAGFTSRVTQIAPDTQAALALVAAGVGVHLTFASVAHSAPQIGVAYLPVAQAHVADVNLRMAWRAGDRDPALEIVRSLVERPDSAR